MRRLLAEARRRQEERKTSIEGNPRLWFMNKLRRQLARSIMAPRGQRRDIFNAQVAARIEDWQRRYDADQEGIRASWELERLRVRRQLRTHVSRL